MSVDFYRHRLKHAAWTWREYDPYHRKPRIKDRVSSRVEKHRARRLERREIEDAR